MANKKKLFKLLLMPLALIAAKGHAEIVELSFDSPTGESKVLLTTNDNYINAAGSLKLKLSAGIDRKVKVTVKNTSGAIVSQSTSGLLGAGDRIITTDGKTYYGAELSINALPEGVYTFQSSILSANNADIQTDSYNVTIDITPPTFSGVWHWGQWVRSTDNMPDNHLMGPFEARRLWVDNITDNTAIVEAVFHTKTPDGIQKSSTPATYDAQSSQVMIGTNSYYSVQNGYHFPAEDGPLIAGFTLKDKAGNITTIEKPVRWNGLDATPYELVAVHNPNYTGNFLAGSPFNGFEAVTAETKIHENPWSAVYRVKKTDWWQYNDYGFSLGYGFCGDNPDYEDGTYVYKIVAGGYQENQMPYQRIGTCSHTSWRIGPVRHNLVLGDDAPVSPKVISVANLWSNSPEWKGPNPGAQNKAISLLGMKVVVEARNYIQIFSQAGQNCTIPVGETECSAAFKVDYPVNSTPTVYWPSYSAHNESGTLAANGDVNFTIDGVPPTINSAVLGSDKIVTIDGFEPDTGAAWGSVTINTGFVRATDTNGVVKDLPASQVIKSGGNPFTIKVPLASLADGNYSLVAYARDNYGNETSKPIGNFTIDIAPPTIQLTTSTGTSTIGTLDDIDIELTDNVTLKPLINSINISGGPLKDNVYLTVRNIGGNKYKLEYPVMFPSSMSGDEYNLTIKASDEQGNVSTQKLTFAYSPRQVTLAGGMDGKVLVPNVQRGFKRANGSEVIATDPLTLNDGSTIAGNYDIYATLRSDAQFPVVINGVTVQPGQTTTVAEQFNFAESGGRINIPAYPANNTIGSSSLLFSTSAPNAPVLVVDLKSWAAVAQLSAQTWDVRQVIDTVNISATPSSGTACRLTSDTSIAQAADAIKDPVCFLEWAQKPDEAAQTIKSGDSLKVAGLVGQAVTVGVQPVTYTLSLFSGGEKITVGTGSRDLTVHSALGEVAYNPPTESLILNRIISSASIGMKQTKGPDCSLTLDGDTARKMSMNQEYASTSRTCLFEYTAIPDGLAQDNYSNTPLLKGTLVNKAKYPLAWRISIFSKSGTRITLNEQSSNIEAIDPPAPVISLDTKYSLNDDANSKILVVPMTAGTYLGDTVITSALADLDVDINRGSDTLESETHPTGYGETQKITRRIITDERKLWETVVYKVSAKYNKVPDVSATSEYSVVSVPSESILPAVSTDSPTAVNTQALPVTVKIRDQYKPENGYNAETMGQWKVRLLRQGTYGLLTPLTDFMETADGSATFNVDLSTIEGTSLRVLAEASLVSPLNGYERVVQSRSPAYLQLLRGNSIGANTITRKLSGPAPFRPLFKLELQNRLDSGALGQVKWQVSSDKGASWVDYIPSANYKMTYQQTFDVGEYLVRAETTNSNSGATEYTENVQIVAYKMPDIQIDGPSPLFIGDSGKYSLSTAPSKYGQAVTDYVESENIVEWSTDSGKNFTLNAPTITLTQSEAGNIPLVVRVRSKNAPDTDDAAWTVVRKNVQFAKVKAPNASIKGPTRVETGKTYIYSVKVSEPYPGMTNALKGYWTLPDGSQVNGTEMTYSPTADDLNTGRLEVSYTAWVDGFRDKGAETTTNARAGVWEYIWPKFALYDVKTATVAPADIVFTIKAVGFSGKLDNPVYTWTIPSGLIVTDKRVVNIRSVTAKTPGSYTVSVKITDARGNTSEQSSSFVIAEPAPYNVGVKYSMSNPEQREPLGLLLSGLINGGHPLDRVVERTYFVDGEKVDSSGEYGRITLNAGTHDVKLAIKSEMGKEASGSVQLVVAQNKIPVCKTKTRETVGSIIVYADCSDEDGRIKGYEWTVNGEVLSSRGDRITLNKDTSSPVPTVSLVGIDDAGGRSAPVSLQ